VRAAAGSGVFDCHHAHPVADPSPIPSKTLPLLSAMSVHIEPKPSYKTCIFACCTLTPPVTPPSVCIHAGDQ
jgi:hypothetical protein